MPVDVTLVGTYKYLLKVKDSVSGKENVSFTFDVKLECIVTALKLDLGSVPADIVYDIYVDGSTAAIVRSLPTYTAEPSGC